LIEVTQPTTIIVSCIQVFRAQQLQRIVNNSRFFLLLAVKIKKLASHVLFLLSRCLIGGWQSRYHIQPVLIETLVDAQSFLGTCYRAASWIELGQTTGRGRQDSGQEHHSKSPKTVFVYLNNTN